jgi:hypothetical protein
MQFYEVEPTLDNYWRAIILFGGNAASYKFALAKALYELSDVADDLVKIEQLAEPFSRHICEHLKYSPKQGTSKSSKFLTACSHFNAGVISREELIKQTVKLGFVDVIGAFHKVNRGEIAERFFIDERKKNAGIRITNNFFKLAEHQQFNNFENETEARWRLVEHAWQLGVSRNLISVSYDEESKVLFTGEADRRVNITSCRDSLNGYQKGRCFYCYTPISVDSSDENLADVDHFLPWTLKENISNINGVWNLVLSCKDCNRGANGKFARVPALQLLSRLHKRNEYLINSHLPLRETLLQQTGNNELIRRQFLQQGHSLARKILIHEWQSEIKGIITF